MKVWIAWGLGSVFSNKDAAIRSLMDYYEPFVRSEHWSESQLREYAEALLEEYEVIEEY